MNVTFLDLHHDWDIYYTASIYKRVSQVNTSNFASVVCFIGSNDREKWFENNQVYVVVIIIIIILTMEYLKHLGTFIFHIGMILCALISPS